MPKGRCEGGEPGYNIHVCQYGPKEEVASLHETDQSDSSDNREGRKRKRMNTEEPGKTINGQTTGGDEHNGNRALGGWLTSRVVCLTT